MSRVCPRCGEKMKDSAGTYVLLSGADVPAFGSKTEIMVSPKNCLRVEAIRCMNPGCMHVEFRVL
jgi:hypothetical protein